MFSIINIAENYRKWSSIFTNRGDYEEELVLLKKAENLIKEALKINPAHGLGLNIYRHICYSMGVALGYRNDPKFFEYLDEAKRDIQLNLSLNKVSKLLKSKIEKKIVFFRKRFGKSKNQELTDVNLRNLEKIGYESNIKDALNVLIEVLEKAAIQGKSIRFIALDKIMRVHTGRKYKGAKSVKNPETDSNFKSFTDFINFCERENLIKSELIDEFREIYLEEKEIYIETNSEDIEIHNLNQIISKEHWELIIKKILKYFTLDDPKDVKFGRFMVLFRNIKTLKKQNLIPYSNRMLKNALEDIIEVELLILQEDGSYRISPGSEEKIDKFIEILLKKQIEEL